MPTSPPEKIRHKSLDFTRGMATILMVLSHALYFFAKSDNPLVAALIRTGNTFAFSIFLFVSAAAGYLSYVSGPDKKSNAINKHVIRRVFVIMAGYYLVAITASLKEKSGGPVEMITDIILFRSLPRFAEFLIPFAVFTLSFLFFKKWYARLAGHLRGILTLSALSYAAGVFLYATHVSGYFEIPFALLAGNQNLRTYPLLWYLPVFAFGLHWGAILNRHLAADLKIKKGVILAAGFYALTMATAVLPVIRPLAWLAISTRWPPAIGFLAIGLTFAYCLEILYLLIADFAPIKRLSAAIIAVGMDSYDIYIVHMLLLFAYELFGGPQSNALLPLLSSFVVLFALSVVISGLNVRWSLPKIHLRHTLTDRYRIKKRYLLIIAMMTVSILLHLNVGNQIPPTGGILPPTKLLRDTLINESPFSDGTVWHETTMPYRRKIRIKNQGKIILPTGYPVPVAGLTDNPVIFLPPVVYHDRGTGKITKLPAVTTETELQINLQAPLAPGETDGRYTLYYDRPDRYIFEYDSGKNGSELPLLLTVQNEITHPIRISLKNWHLLSDGSEPPYLTARISWNAAFHPKRVKTPEKFVAVIAGQDQKTYDCRTTGSGCTLRINLGSFAPGKYTLTVQNPETGEVNSLTAPFYLSYPVYAAWTLDWEGGDISDSAYAAIDDISQKYGVPITHFVNPRAFMTAEISDDRKEKMGNYLKTRLKIHKDEAALHTHMQTDLVIAAGVTPRRAPRWGSSGESEGYDVPMTAYTEDEIRTILSFCLLQFEKNGLPKPRGFRAGGWYADNKVLSALEATGFAYDSSGRLKTLWGGLKESPWDLPVDAQPYFPSVSDQNSGTDPVRNLMEIPNTAGNTYEDSTDGLIAKFQTALEAVNRGKTARVILSHPNWAENEFPKISAMFDYLRQYRYDEDTGPVVFVTAGTIYDLWKE